jgi:holo-[acyl-carrier protein] synthase
MIKGIGIDAVEIERFHAWHTYPPTRLQKIFSPEEITYCLRVPKKSAERFAVRFCAKEAFLKALTSYGKRYPLLRICRAISVRISDEAPQLSVDWASLGLKPLKVHFSLSHTRISAHAVVIVEE